ncbi:MAG: MAPEG family protein [Hyphomicrobiaceae bacterium]|nr:MAPEG family protein [Hyphomicrobiaceae bacterium]
MTLSTMTADLTYSDNARVVSARQPRRRRRPPFGLSTSVWAFIRTFIAASLTCLSAYAITDYVIDWQPLAWGVADRLALVAKAAALAAFPVLAAITVVAAQRLNAKHFANGDVKRGSALDINARFISNTYEQFLVFFAGNTALSLYVTPVDAQTVPILGAMFLAGRLVYWWGYHHNTYIRSFGFGLTFYPTVAVYAWLVLHVTTGLYFDI